MALTDGWLPPTREHWELMVFGFSLFPLFTVTLWFSNNIQMGKNSRPSRLNIPGKIGWATMEAPGFISLLLTMHYVQKSQGIESLPLTNWLMAALYTTHYIYRSLLSPLLLAPSMSPMHLTVWASALSFQIVNGACIGGWLGGYGPTSNTDWEAHTPRILLGLAIFVLGFAGNIYHDDELRSLRRTAARESQEIQQQTQEKKGMRERERDGKGKGQAGSAQKVYKVPQAGLFRYILYPHYFCEWVEWIGYWIIGGWACAPARNFVANEVAAMMPQAVDGKRWYVSRFGREVEGRRAILPGVL